MGIITSRYSEIIIRITPINLLESGDSRAKIKDDAGSNETRLYGALVYSDLVLPGLNPPSDAFAERLREAYGMKLVGVEQVEVRWRLYQQYLSTFLLGEKAASSKLWEFVRSFNKEAREGSPELHNKLFKISSKAFADMLRGDVQTNQPVRIWWDCVGPEAVDLPWELLTYRSDPLESKKFSFVRGHPPKTPIPKIPVTDPLHLAFIHEERITPSALSAALKELPGIKVVDITGPPRQAFQQVVGEGYELVHIVADASVNLAYEGVLHFRKTDSATTPSEELKPHTRRALRLVLNISRYLKKVVPDSFMLWIDNKLYKKLDIELCSPRDLSEMMRGSRVALISFTAPKTDDDDPDRLDGLLLPKVYKAFAYIGNSAMPLPNIAAPLSAISEEQLTSFWKAFYEYLSSSLSVEEAVAHAHQKVKNVPIALFLRQRLGRDFTRSTASKIAEAKEPTQLNAELQVSRDLLAELRAIDSSYKDLSDKVSESPLVKEEMARQSVLQEQLDDFMQLEESEL